MELKARLEFDEPVDLLEVQRWLEEQSENGFSPHAQVRIGKTTGQRPVLIVTEER